MIFKRFCISDGRREGAQCKDETRMNKARWESWKYTSCSQILKEVKLGNRCRTVKGLHLDCENSERSTLGLWKQRGRGKLIIARMEYRGYPHGVPEGRLPGEVRHLPGTRYYLYSPCDKNSINNFWVAENNRIWTLLKLYYNKFFSAEEGKGKRQHPKILWSLKNIPCRWLLSFVTESLYICFQDVDLIYICVLSLNYCKVAIQSM